VCEYIWTLFALYANTHWAVHKILRMPPNSISRELSHSLGGFTHIEPCALESYCAACLYRFASSERSYFLSLERKIKERVLLCLPFSERRHRYLPSGGLSSPCILQQLLDALDFKGFLTKIHDSCEATPAHSWILNFPRAPAPSVYSGIQSAVIRILQPVMSVRDMQ
jgi:hypothetical protein